MRDKDQEQHLTIELDDTTADGVYSNLAIINHSPSEFVVDFVSIMPPMPKAKVKSRIILTPQHAKRLLRALDENIQNFERSFGKIQETESAITPIVSFATGEA